MKRALLISGVLATVVTTFGLAALHPGAFEDRVAANADRLFNYQMTIARGASYLFRIHTDSDGKRSKPELGLVYTFGFPST
ncbi:hypothetical protein AB0P28_05945 [Pseudarthrobacter sp. NPDC089323]